MEAAPHMLASLMIVLGLWRALTGRGIAPWLIAAAIAAPLLRYEGLALSLLAAVVLFLHGQRRPAAAIAAASVGTVVAFSLFLMALGLDPLPGSILAKTAGFNALDGLPMRLVLGTLVNLLRPAGVILAALVVLTALLLAALPALWRGAPLWLLSVTGLAALAHLMLGKIGWMHRYEPYALASLLGALLLASSALAGRAAQAVRGTVIVAVLAAGLVYMPKLWGAYVWNPRAIHLQQARMARFAQEYVKAPVAVNDLGRVAWGNPDYVLDIWGLAFAEARRLRFGPAAPADGWAGLLATAHGVKAAMIFDKWFASAVGPDWVRLATLSVTRPKGAIGDWKVAIYATDAANAAALRDRLVAFAPTLPGEAVLTLEGGGA